MKKVIKNRKGSHVGVVVSFVVFVTFLLFIYSILEPALENKERRESALQNLETNLIEELSLYLNSSVIDVGNSGQNCIEISDEDFGRRVIVRSGNLLLSSSVTSSGNLQVERSGEDFFKIYSSEGFEEVAVDDSLNCVSVSEGSGYERGLTKNSRHVFESEIYELISEYSDYGVLRARLGVPEDSDFGFGLIYNNGSLVETSFEGITENVYIKEIPISYVNLDGEILSGFLKLRIW